MRNYGSKTTEYILEKWSRGTSETAIHFSFVMINIKVTLLLIHKTFHLMSAVLNYLNNVLMYHKFQRAISS